MNDALTTWPKSPLPFINNTSLDWFDSLYKAIPDKFETDFFKWCADNRRAGNIKSTADDKYETLFQAQERDFVIDDPEKGYKYGDILKGEWESNHFVVVILTRFGNICIFDDYDRTLKLCYDIALGAVIGNAYTDPKLFRAAILWMFGICEGPYQPTDSAEVNYYPFTNNIGFRIESLMDKVGML